MHRTTHFGTAHSVVGQVLFFVARARNAANARNGLGYLVAVNIQLVFARIIGSTARLGSIGINVGEVIGIPIGTAQMRGVDFERKTVVERLGVANGYVGQRLGSQTRTIANVIYAKFSLYHKSLIFKRILGAGRK